MVVENMTNVKSIHVNLDVHSELYKMKGPGKNYNDLIRILIARSKTLDDIEAFAMQEKNVNQLSNIGQIINRIIHRRKMEKLNL